MYKSKQKIIGISIASVAILGGFAVATWAIIDASYKIPKGNSLTAKYMGMTSYLGDAGSFNIEKMSVSDWINANYPTKMLVEGLDNNNYSIYYYTDPDKSVLSDTEWKALKDPTKFIELNSKSASPLICKINVSQTANSYSYTVYANEHFAVNQNPELAKVTFDFSNNGQTINNYSISSDVNINNTNPITVNNNVISFDQGISATYSFNLTNDNYSLKMDVGSGGVNTYGWELKFSKTSIENKFNNFNIINNNGTNSLGTYSTYNTVNDLTNGDNYKLYNITHQQLNNGVGGQTLNKNQYQKLWTTEKDNELAQLHLPNNVGLISFMPQINQKQTTG